MADQTTLQTEVETPEAFLADRQAFWSSFTSATFAATVAVVVVLIGLAVFLL